MGTKWWGSEFFRYRVPLMDMGSTENQGQAKEALKVLSEWSVEWNDGLIIFLPQMKESVTVQPFLQNLL